MKRKIIFYTRRGCHLCDDAKALLKESQQSHSFEIEEIDIDGDPELVRKYGDKVPVIEIDGRPRLWGVINEVLLRRLLKADG